MQADVIVVAAGRRTGEQSPRPLLRVGAETVIGRQLRLTRAMRQIVVLGHAAGRLSRELPLDAQLVLNHGWADTNAAVSVACGLSRSRADFSVVLYADLVFGENLLAAVPLDRSGVVVTVLPEPLPGKPRKKSTRPNEVGASTADGRVVRFGYGVADKWGQVLVLSAADREKFISVATEPRRAKHFTHEILNELIEQGVSLAATAVPQEWLVEVDGPQHLAAARLLTNSL